MDFEPLPLSTPPGTPQGTTSRRSQSNSLGSPLNPNSRLSSSHSLVPLAREGSSGSSSGHDGAVRPKRWSQTGSPKRGSQQLDPASLGVLSGQYGGSFGPFPRSSTYSPTYGGQGQAPFNYRDSISSSDVAIDVGSERALLPSLPNRYSTASMASSAWGPDSPGYDGQKTPIDTSLLWDKENAEADDFLHNPDPELERMLDKQWSSWSLRGWFNVGVLSTLIILLVGLFAGWPIYRYVIKGGFPSQGGSSNLGWNIGGINSTGQVPKIAVPGLIDTDTPTDVYQRVGFDGETYNLVFSDEFNIDGRTFWPGDDPWWEAVDLHYWATTDLEWYDPDAVTTEGGQLVIQMTEEPIHDLNFRSGMLQSWNKFCYTGGYVEVSMSLPGSATAQGFWPAAWSMGNLGRAGYGSSVEGMWPYSYGACDVGTLPNQTFPNGTWPTAAKTSGSHDYGGELSYLTGQRASACTCPGEDHPGPSNDVGRGAPEIDINEAQVDYRLIGSTSQSIQLAPMDAGYAWLNTTPYIEIYNTTGTFQNTWQGSVSQQSLSVITLTDKTSYQGNGYTNFGYEYDPGPSGRITWAVNGTRTWQLNADAIGPNVDAEISQRLISVEPMSINLNLAISNKFQQPEWGKLDFSTKKASALRIDYVRVYQKGKPNIGCDPSGYPTSDYINRHLETYMNPNITTWIDYARQNNLTYPRNSLGATGCA